MTERSENPNRRVRIRRTTSRRWRQGSAVKDANPEAGSSTSSIVPGIILLLGFSALLFVIAQLVDLGEIRKHVVAAGSLAPLVYIAAKALTYIVAPMGGGVLHVFAGAVFGLPRGVAYTLAGDTIGGCVNFIIARYLGKPMVARFVGRRGVARVEHYVQWLERNGGLVSARLFLNPVYDFISYAAGFTTLTFARYFTVSVVAGIPPTVLFVGLGASLTNNSGVQFAVYGGCVVLFALPVLLWSRLSTPRDNESAGET